MANVYLVREYYKDYDYRTGYNEEVERILEEHPAFLDKDAAQKLVDELNEKNVVTAYKEYLNDIRKRNEKLAQQRLALRAAEETGNEDLIRAVKFHDPGMSPLLSLEDFRKAEHRPDRQYEVAEWELA